VPCKILHHGMEGIQLWGGQACAWVCCPPG
jgi:hypothetical protein